MTCIAFDISLFGLVKAIFPPNSAGKFRMARADRSYLSAFETLLG